MKKKEESLESDLWSKCETLDNRFNEKIKSCKTFINLLSSISDSFDTFAGILKKNITKYSKIYIDEDKDSTLSKGLQNIIINLQLQVTQFKEISDWLQTECVEGFDKFIEDYIPQERKLYSTYKASKKTLNTELKSLENYKEKYYESAYAAEKALINANKHKSQNLKNEEETENTSTHDTPKDSMHKAKTHESEYLRKIEAINKLREIKIANEKEMLSNYKLFEECINCKLQSVHNSYIFKFQDAFSIVSNDLNKLYNNKSDINVTSDFNNFVIKNKNQKKADDVIEFIPYCPNILKKTDENSSLVIEVVSEIQKNLKDSAPNYDPKKKKRALEITVMTKNIFEKNDPTLKQKILDCINNKEDRDSFIMALNQQRTKTYEYSVDVINNLKDIIIKILELCSQEHDYSTIKNCIILCQTYYYMDGSNKHFLFEDIKDYYIFKSLDFWNKFIDVLLISTLENKISGDLTNVDDKKIIINNTVFPELLHYSNDMLEFDVDKDKVYALVAEKRVKYDLSDDLYKIILDNIRDSHKK